MFPQPLGPFVLTSLLGEGGTSFVYAATREGVELALKVLRPELGLEPREVERFVGEARRMHALSHPNLVQVLDAGILPDGRPYIAMPRLRGRALADKLADRGRLEVPHALALLAGLVSAVSTLHRAGLVHRDIKPENVLWLDPPDERLVLLDLGIARELDAGPSTTTQAGFARGTPAYMAPERFFGQPATIASDVYELALVFYVAVVARLPWDPADPKARMSPRAPSELGVQLPPELSRVLLTALSAGRDERPASVDELHARLVDAWQRAASTPYSDPALSMAATELHRPESMPAPSPERGGSTLPSAAHAGSGGQISAQPSGTTGLAVVGTMRSAHVPSSTGVALAVGGAVALFAALGGAAAVYYARGVNFGDTAKLSGEGAEASDVDADDDEPKTKKRKKRTRDDVESTVDGAPSASAVASASAPASASAVASASAPASAARVPTAPRSPSAVPAPAAPPVASSAAPASGPMPKPCADLIALMCSPTSGARPEECVAWKGNVAHWNATMPPAAAAETCQSTYTTSVPGLKNRRDAMSPDKP
jgi:eukaryotic-like serine/threonine-protein kinase